MLKRGGPFSSSTTKPTTPTTKKANGTKPFAACTTWPNRARGGDPVGYVGHAALQQGSLFTWTVFDYPLKQAIIDNVVKRPLKGVASGMEKPLRHRQRALPGLPDGRGQPLARIPRQAQAAQAQTCPLSSCSTAPAKPTTWPTTCASNILTNSPGISCTSSTPTGAAMSPWAIWKNARQIAQEIDEPGQPGQLHRQRADAARRAGTCRA
jgi:hypothetical protein